MVKSADFAVALDNLAGCIAWSQRLGRDLDGVVDDDAPRVLGWYERNIGSVGCRYYPFVI